MAAKSVVDLPGSGGGTVHIYSLDAIILIGEGPPAFVVGTETCVLGFHLGGQITIRMSASLAMETLGYDPDRCLRLTNPQTKLPYHILCPERVLAVSGTDRGSTVLLRGFGILVVTEPPSEICTAISELPPVEEATP